MPSMNRPVDNAVVYSPFALNEMGIGKIAPRKTTPVEQENHCRAYRFASENDIQLIDIGDVDNLFLRIVAQRSHLTPPTRYVPARKSPTCDVLSASLYNYSLSQSFKVETVFVRKNKKKNKILKLRLTHKNGIPTIQPLMITVFK